MGIHNRYFFGKIFICANFCDPGNTPKIAQYSDGGQHSMGIISFMRPDIYHFKGGTRKTMEANIGTLHYGDFGYNSYSFRRRFDNKIFWIKSKFQLSILWEGDVATM